MVNVMVNAIVNVIMSGIFLSVSLGFLVGTAANDIGLGILACVCGGIVNGYNYLLANS